MDDLVLPAELAAELEDTDAAPGPLRVAAEVVRESLPPEWRAARSLVQWTSSAGMRKSKGLGTWGDWTHARCRVWLYLDRPVHDDVCAARQGEIRAFGLDASVFRTVQAVYVSPPLFVGTDGKPLPDPLAGRRCVELPGTDSAPVPDWLPPIDVFLDEKAEQDEGRAERAQKREERSAGGERPAGGSAWRDNAVVRGWNASRDLRADLGRVCEPGTVADRWTWPGASGVGGVVLLGSDRWYSHHDSAPRKYGDAFDLFALLECGGDYARAYREARRVLGLDSPPPVEPPVEAEDRLSLAEAEAATVEAVAEALAPDAPAGVVVLKSSPGTGKSHATWKWIAKGLVDAVEARIPPAEYGDTLAEEIERLSALDEIAGDDWRGPRFAIGLKDWRSVRAVEKNLRKALRAEVVSRGYRWLPGQTWAKVFDAFAIHARPVRVSNPRDRWGCDSHAEWSRRLVSSAEAAAEFCGHCDRIRSRERARCRFMRNGGPSWSRNRAGAAVTIATLPSLLFHGDGAADFVVVDESPLDTILPALSVTPRAIRVTVDAGALVVSREGEALDGEAVVAGLEAWADGGAPPDWSWAVGEGANRAMKRIAHEWTGEGAPPEGLPWALVRHMEAESPRGPRLHPDARDGDPDCDPWTWSVAGWTRLPERWKGVPVLVLDATATPADARVIASAIGEGVPARTVEVAAQWHPETRVVTAEADTHRRAVGDRETHPQRRRREAWATFHARADELGTALHLTHKKLREGGHHPEAEAVVAGFGGMVMHYGEAGARGGNDAEACEVVALDSHTIPKGATEAWAEGYSRYAGLSADEAARCARERSSGDWIQAMQRVRAHRRPRTIMVSGEARWIADALRWSGLPEVAEHWTAADLDDWTAERTGRIDGLRDVVGWLIRFVGRKLEYGQAVRVRTRKIHKCQEHSARARTRTHETSVELACPPSIGGALRAIQSREKRGSDVWARVLREAGEYGWTLTRVATDAGGHGHWFAHRAGELPAEAIGEALEAEGCRWWRVGDGERRWLAPPPELERLCAWFAELGGEAVFEWIQRVMDTGDDSAAGEALFPTVAAENRPRALRRARATLAEYRGDGGEALALAWAALDWTAARAASMRLRASGVPGRVRPSLPALHALRGRTGRHPGAAAVACLAGEAGDAATLSRLARMRGDPGRLRELDRRAPAVLRSAAAA